MADLYANEQIYLRGDDAEACFVMWRGVVELTVRPLLLVFEKDESGRQNPHSPRKKSLAGTLTLFAIRNNASMEMIFSPRSTSPIYFQFRSTCSANFSCVRCACFRKWRIASPMIFRWRKIGFCLDFPTTRQN